MGQKRHKLVIGLGSFIPESINFSELDKDSKNLEDPPTAQYGDSGLFVEKMETSFEFEELVVQILFSLKDEERTIFLYQLLRDFGYQIDHGSFAKTLSIKRQKYMQILDRVRKKTLYIVQQRSEKKQTLAI